MAQDTSALDGANPEALDERPPRKRDNLTAKTASGMKWTYLSTLVTGVSTMAYTAVISRLLDPRAFGLMAVATMATVLGNFLARMGVAQAIIQKPDLKEEDVRAAATAALVLGAICFTGMWFLAPSIAGFFRKPDSIPLLRWMGVSFFFVGLSMTSQGLLRRAMRFRELATVRITTQVLGYLVVGLGMAVTGFGVWSLVGAALTSNFLGWFLQYLYVRHPLRPTFDFRPFKELYSFGARSSAIRFLDYLGSNLDTFVVGRVASAALLGQYNRGFVLVHMPLTNFLATALTSVMFPGFSRIQNDPQRLRRAYVGVMSLGGIVLFPLCAGLAIAAPDVVQAVLGHQWDRAIPLIPWFATAAAFNVMSKFAELLTEARAELNKAMLLQGMYVLLLTGLLAIAVGSGLWAFAAALAAGEIVRHVAYLLLMRRLVGLTFSDVRRAYLPSIFAVVTVGTLVAVGRLVLGSVGATALVAFIGEMLLGAVGLVLAIRWNPLSTLRYDLWYRLNAAGVLRSPSGVKYRFARTALGSPPSGLWHGTPQERMP